MASDEYAVVVSLRLSLPQRHASLESGHKAFSVGHGPCMSVECSSQFAQAAVGSMTGTGEPAQERNWAKRNCVATYNPPRVPTEDEVRQSFRAYLEIRGAPTVRHQSWLPGLTADMQASFVNRQVKVAPVAGATFVLIGVGIGARRSLLNDRGV